MGSINCQNVPKEKKKVWSKKFILGWKYSVSHSLILLLVIPSAWFRFTIFIYRYNFHSNKKIGAVYLYQLIVITCRLYSTRKYNTPPKPINYSEKRTKRQEKCVLNMLNLESKEWILLSDWLTQITVLNIERENQGTAIKDSDKITTQNRKRL